MSTHPRRNRHRTRTGTQKFLAAAIAAVMVIICPRTAAAQEAFLEAETAAIQAAVANVAEAVVRIELVGVAEVSSEVQADAPTVGTVVDPDGWILASSLVTAQPSASILIVKPDGTRQTARVVATDSARELVLLKTESETPMAALSLPTETAPRVGQYAIAVGRVAGSEQPAISVGILSAVDRLEGRALQTDARVSPIFYGGPLLDIQGRLMGILVPAMPEAAGADEKSGWYDSGIAFAVPADAIAKRLASMKEGRDIHRGLLGIVSAGSDPYASGTKIDAVRARSPADRAGIMPNDEITAIAGVEVRHQYEIRQELGRFDAGDQVELDISRDGKSLQLQATLAESIPPLELQTIGLYTRTSDEGVQVTAVEPDSPAAKAGVQPQDLLLELDEQPIASLDSLRRRVATADPQVPLSLRIQRDGNPQNLQLSSRSLAGPLRPLPTAEAAEPAAEGDWELAELTLPDVANKVAYYAPKNLADDPPQGFLMVLLDPGKQDPGPGLQRWQAAARRSNVAVAAITPADESRWTPAESDVVGRAATQLAKRSGLDRSSVGVTGDEKGASFAMALITALTEKEAISGIAAIVDLQPPAIRLRENDPELPLQLALPLIEQAELPTWAGVLPKIGFPIVRTAENQPDVLLQWVRTLSRI